MTQNTTVYRAARDELLELRGRHDQAVRSFNWPQVSGTFNWAIDWFDHISTGQERAALIVVQEDGTSETLSYDNLRRQSNRAATWLASLGVLKGDRVLIMLGNQVELWVTMLAVMKLGAVVMPTTTALGTDELQDRLSRGRALFVICNKTDTDKFDGVEHEFTRISVGGASGWHDLAKCAGVSDDQLKHPATQPTDPLLLYFTSGTTSQPKLVEHTQVSYPVGHLSTMYWLGLKPGDIHLNISSPGWAKHAWSCFFAPFIAEATVFISCYTRFRPDVLLEQLERFGVTTLCAPPTVWRMLIQHDMGKRPSELREAVGAGEPLNPEVIEQVQKAWGLTLRDGFGQTEMSAAVGNTPGSEVRPGSMGRPLPGMPVVLVDQVSGMPAQIPGEGEICLDLTKTPQSLMARYVDDQDRTAEAMRGGFYHTGDLAAADADGYITYIGRTDDVFKASDYKISPFELESVLLEHPAVAEAAVVPAPDILRLAVPKAYVALAEGFSPDEETALDILLYARSRLAPFQRVKRLEFAEIPKTISGKIRRVELRLREVELEGTRIAGEWRDDALASLV